MRSVQEGGRANERERNVEGDVVVDRKPDDGSDEVELVKGFERGGIEPAEV